ncbi:hypothetical protein [Deinococcus ruber]|uniref:Uncharacterized protein n=1 Tax=Deinococcus ruber TaxID=1848197 RepID=A0A918FA73_9DEIO|nr:hypothetical protein [Deinococcus ruber]GGR15818.1 hypothetical protein GCM10008957_30700 [Deinococcus ruber]
MRSITFLYGCSEITLKPTVRGCLLQARTPVRPGSRAHVQQLARVPHRVNPEPDQQELVIVRGEAQAVRRVRRFLADFGTGPLPFDANVALIEQGIGW